MPYRTQNNAEGSSQNSAGQEEGLIDARLRDWSRGKAAGDAGPPIRKQPNVHRDVADHAWNERARGPREKPKQNSGTENNGHYADHRPRFGEMQEHEQERGHENGDRGAVSLFDRLLHVATKAGL